MFAMSWFSSYNPFTLRRQIANTNYALMHLHTTQDRQADVIDDLKAALALARSRNEQLTSRLAQYEKPPRVQQARARMSTGYGGGPSLSVIT